MRDEGALKSPFHFSSTSTYECLQGPGHHKGTHSPRSRGPAMSLDNIPRRPSHREKQHAMSNNTEGSVNLPAMIDD